LDAAVDSKDCRIAFFGRAVAPLPGVDTAALRRLNLYKWKEKAGVVDRVVGEDGLGVGVVGRGLFRKDTNMAPFVGLVLEAPQSGRTGAIESSFGQGGKFRATLRAPEGASAPAPRAGDRLVLRFRKFLFQHERKGVAAMVQKAVAQFGAAALGAAPLPAAGAGAADALWG
jgi:selenocysteine-specific elongation factor